VQISSPGSYGLSSPSRAASSGSSGSAGATALGATDSAQDNSVVQEFLNYAKMSPADRLRANIMKSMGLTQQQFDALSPAEQQAVEQKIEQVIKQEMQQNADKTGQLVNISA
jgi:phenylacetate-coenzyme A ligase PaaK-like adenylate-forming protein